ncbi:MAG: hypothetical protein NC416_14740 [Eubacterium sp.]|nr:hypothetical protein [Eubacterium sp.]
MRIHNASIEKFIQHIQDKQVYIYGLGEVYRQLAARDTYRLIHPSVVGYLDNGKAGQEIMVSGRHCPVHGVEYLRTVESAVVLLCSTKQLDSMYQALCAQNLPDSVECFILPLIWAVSDGKDDEDVLKKIQMSKDKPEQIDRKIHCFWFSGEDKPEDYRRCIDSWKRVCPDYEIIEWNAENYDCQRTLFMKQAYEKRKWAFVSDYARLDVIYRYGGIYLDMDVELLKRPDAWLKFDAFFNFGTQHDIDLGSGFGSVKENPFVGQLLELYRDRDFCDRNGTPMVWEFVQPVYIRDTFKSRGIRLDGSMQLVDDMLILPRRYHTPVDDFLFDNYVQSGDTVGIHHYNAGWCGEEFLRQRKVKSFWRETAKKLI